MHPSERAASRFHEAYARLAHAFRYPLRPEDRVRWADVPVPHRRLLIAVVEELVALGVVHYGDHGDSQPASP